MSRTTMWRLTPVLVLFCYCSVTGSVMADAVKTPDRVSRDGTINLNWQADYSGYEQLSVRKASGGDVAVYPVVDGQNWSLSGLSDGDYLLVLTNNQRTHTILSLRVDHYSLPSALSLFAVGLVLFAYLIITLKRGEARND